MAATLKLEIVTPAGTVYAEDVEMVTLPGVAGQMGIYPRHVPLMTQLVPGEMIVRKEAVICSSRRARDSSRSPPAAWPDGSPPAGSPCHQASRPPSARSRYPVPRHPSTRN